MIKKIILSAMIFFFTYSIYIIFRRPASIPQNQWQTNVIKVQNYLYETNSTRPVIVGSSLTFLLNINGTQDKYYDLSFAGGSPMDGLAIIQKIGAIPECILIEYNVFNRTDTLNLEKSVLIPIICTIKKHLPSLQEKYQPVSVFMPYIYKLIFKFQTLKGNSKAENIRFNPKKNIGRGGAKASSVFTMMLDRHKKAYTTITETDKKIIENKLIQLRRYVDYFKKQNVIIIFFEMPVDKSLCDAPRAVYMRESLHEMFSPSDYHYIPMKNCADYRTNDGIHLDADSSSRYREYLLEEADKIMAR